MDVSLFSAINGAHSPALDDLMLLASAIGKAGFFWLTVAAIAAVFPGRRMAAWRVVLAVGMAYLAVDVLIKPFVGRPRPYEVLSDVRLIDQRPVTSSFPSGHAATALSQMTGSTILISVPRLKVVPLEELSLEIGPPEEPVAAVLMAMLGDITGRTLLVFPRAVALRLASILTRRSFDQHTGLGPLGESALKEAGNILSGAYLNALSEFMGMMLLNSPPDLAIDMSAA